MNTNIPVKKIRRAQIRYFEKNRNACEIPEINAYTYFLDLNGVYVNIFHPFDEYNIYDRLPYSNSTSNGEEFGTVIKLVSGNIEDGVCYVLDRSRFEFGDKKYISAEELESIIINMDEFVVDRLSILESKKNISIIKRKKIIKSDMKKLQELQDYINSKEKGNVKKIQN